MRRARTKVLGTVTVLLSVLALPGTAYAGEIDQQQGVYANTSDFLHAEASLAQTFTAGRTGMLDRVDFYVYPRNTPPAPVILEIRPVDANGAPGPTVLASATVDGSDGVVPVRLPPTPVVAGTQYAYVLHTDTVYPNAYQVYGTYRGADAYTGGRSWAAAGPTGPWTGAPPNVGSDFWFKTYIAAPAATTTSVTSSPNPSAPGAPVTVTATVSATDATGTVAFASDGAALPGCEAVPLSGSAATCSATNLGVGLHRIIATYSGDAAHQASTGSLTQVVQKTATTLVAEPARRFLFNGFRATLTRTSGGLPLAGRTVTFTVSGRTVCSATTDEDGQARCTRFGFIFSADTYTATFAGNDEYQPATATGQFR